MKIKDGWDTYYQFTGKASDVTRQLAFAGLALVWFLSAPEPGRSRMLQGPLLGIAGLLVMALALDLIQYLFAGTFWRLFTRRHEKRNGEAEFESPLWFANAMFGLFLAKCACNVAGYAILLQQIYARVRG